MSAIAKWIIALSICGACVAISYFFVDRPFAYFAHDQLREYRAIFDLAGRLPNVLGPFIVGCTLIFGIRASMGHPLTEIQTAIVLSALSLALSVILAGWLKFAFGRTWPETWVQANPSLIRDGVHNFNPFHGGIGFAAFPSGHMVAISAITSAFWLLYLQSRWICAICIATVFVGQLGANYHFVSDLIAGGFIGFSVGLMMINLWECRAPLKSSSENKKTDRAGSCPVAKSSAAAR
jgi:membrane-associated phospholipid phosphatase